MHIIEMFMWGYQHYYRILAQSAAKQIFGLLDERLQPRVFLVGVLAEERDDHHTICLEPEDCGYEQGQFSGVWQDAARLEEEDEDRNLIHSHPVAQERNEANLKLKSLRDAIAKIVQRQDEERGVISYCSAPVLVAGYRVCVVLQLDRGAVQGQYTLKKNRAKPRISLSTSLLDAVIDEFFEDCQETLLKPEPGSSMSVVKRDAEEILRAAGRILMQTVAWAGGELEGVHEFFRACNVISSLRYEGAEGIGQMIVARRDHPNVEVELRLESPVKTRDFRAVRKLLEMTSSEANLLTDSGYVYGLGKVVGDYDEAREDLFIVAFLKHYSWELLHAGHVMMVATYGQPSLPKQPVDRAKFESNCRRIFRSSPVLDVQKLWPLVVEATRQRHGTMLVISARAAEETSRLEKQCTKITPVPLSPHLTRIVTAIDGSVLVAPDGTCHAVGVILDGIASEKGTPARGARYNSAIRYAEIARDCLILVVSEDGSVELIPDLMPQIPRSHIEAALSELQTMAAQTNVSIKKFNQLMEWFSHHRFYLLPPICDAVNSLKPQVEARLESTQIRIIHNDLTPDAEMNDSYFLDE